MKIIMIGHVTWGSTMIHIYPHYSLTYGWMKDKVSMKIVQTATLPQLESDFHLVATCLWTLLQCSKSI